jgi:hypothetical protein
VAHLRARVQLLASELEFEKKLNNRLLSHFQTVSARVTPHGDETLADAVVRTLDHLEAQNAQLRAVTNAVTAVGDATLTHQAA